MNEKNEWPKAHKFDPIKVVFFIKERSFWINHSMVSYSNNILATPTPKN